MKSYDLTVDNGFGQTFEIQVVAERSFYVADKKTGHLVIDGAIIILNQAIEKIEPIKP